MASGVGLTLLGLLGLAGTVGRADSDGLVRMVFVPLYVAGAACLIAGGVWWLILWSRRRDSR